MAKLTLTDLKRVFGFFHKQSDENSLLALFSLKYFLIFTQQWRLFFCFSVFLIKRISSLKASSKSLHLKCFYRSNKELFIIIISRGVWGDARRCLDGSIKTKRHKQDEVSFKLNQFNSFLLFPFSTEPHGRLICSFPHPPFFTFNSAQIIRWRWMIKTFFFLRWRCFHFY